MTKDGGRGFAGLDALLSDVASATQDSKSPADGPPVGPQSATVSPAEPGAEPTLPSVSAAGTPPSQDSSVWLFVVLGAVVLGGTLLFMSSGRTDDPVPDRALTQPAPPSPPVALTPKREVLAVAARNANLRTEPSGKARIVGTLPRGATLEVLAETNGFVNCKTAAQPEGWIARSVLIGEADATRLAGMSADDYVESRKSLQVVERLAPYLQAHQSELLLLRGQVLLRSPLVSETIRALESQTKPADIPVDAAAGTWFSLAARASLDNGDDAESFRSAAAAVFGDPLNADYHMALGYAAIKQENKETISAVSTVLLALAPGSTNTWVIVGVAAAMDDLPPLAAGAFAEAISRSRSRSTTIKVLKEVAAKARDARISSAIEAALGEANNNSSSPSLSNTAKAASGGT